MENNLCIYCGSAAGADPRFARSARRVGRAIAENGVGLVYGGGCVGLMGIVADAVLESGGKAIGVIPEALVAREIAHQGLTELHVVRDMHERKAMMANRSSAFLTLPGGIGTFEEFFETLSWASLGLHQKPMAVLNVAGYFDPLIALLDHSVAQQFVKPENSRLVVVSDDPESLVREMVGRASAKRARQSIDFGHDSSEPSRNS
jgi:uncharacterized protein (TIGR00730 family)